MNVELTDARDVHINVDIQTAATLAATIHFLCSPHAGPYRRTHAARELQPLADALCSLFGFAPEVTP